MGREGWLLERYKKKRSGEHRSFVNLPNIKEEFVI
jgi:hypothetical protein